MSEPEGRQGERGAMRAEPVGGTRPGLPEEREMSEPECPQGERRSGR
jgi:hypothetical protein